MSPSRNARGFLLGLGAPQGAAGGGGGSPPGTFDGTTLVEDFSSYAAGAGLPDAFTLTAVGATNPWAPDILAADDPDNTDPLAGQILRVEPPATNFGSNALVEFNELLGEAAEGEILMLTRHPPTGFNTNAWGAHPALAMSVANQDVVSFGIQSTFFTTGYRDFFNTYYQNSSNPRAALGDWLWIRVQRIGGNVKGKWWKVLDPEPGVWRFDGNPSGLPVAGSQNGGIYIKPDGSANGRGYDISYLAFTNDPVGTPLAVPDLP